jgi:hypothetical protein
LQHCQESIQREHVMAGTLLGLGVMKAIVPLGTCTITPPNPTFACAVKGAGPQWGKTPPGNWFAPPGSNRSRSGGDEAAGASGVEGRFRRLGESAGRNESERCAGPETGDAGADPPRNEGKLTSVGEYERTSPLVLPGYWRWHADKGD